MNAFLRWPTQHQINILTWNVRHRNTHICATIDLCTPGVRDCVHQVYRGLWCNIIIISSWCLQRRQPWFCGRTLQRFWRGKPWTCWPSPCTRTAHRLESAMVTSVGNSLNHATHIIVQRAEVGRAGWPWFRGSVAGDVVGKPVLRHLGLVGRDRFLLEHNHMHPGVQRVLHYLDAFTDFIRRTFCKTWLTFRDPGPSPSALSPQSPETVRAKGRLSTFGVDVLGGVRRLATSSSSG